MYIACITRNLIKIILKNNLIILQDKKRES